MRPGTFYAQRGGSPVVLRSSNAAISVLNRDMRGNMAKLAAEAREPACPCQVDPSRLNIRACSWHRGRVLSSRVLLFGQPLVRKIACGDIAGFPARLQPPLFAPSLPSTSASGLSLQAVILAPTINCKMSHTPEHFAKLRLKALSNGCKRNFCKNWTHASSPKRDLSKFHSAYVSIKTRGQAKCNRRGSKAPIGSVGDTCLGGRRNTP